MPLQRRLSNLERRALSILKNYTSSVAAVLTMLIAVGAVSAYGLTVSQDNRTQALESTETFYVKVDGDDAKDGRSLANAWKSFDRAWEDVGPGDTLLIADGTYYQQLNPSTNGTSTQRIYIKAINDGQVTIDMKGEDAAIKLGYPRDEWGDYFTIEGLVARNGKENAIMVRADNNILKRISAYNASADVNSQVILFWGNNNTIEDCAVSGTGRYMINAYDNSNNTTIRRCFTKWERWDGKNFCGVSWPNGNNIGIYNSSNSTVENSIAYGKSLTGIFAQANDSEASAIGNKILGSIAVLQGKNYDGNTWNYFSFPDRPKPTEDYYNQSSCDDKVTQLVGMNGASEEWISQRTGFTLYGQGSVQGNIFRDLLSVDNAGVGLDSDARIGDGGTVYDHITALNNGSGARYDEKDDSKGNTNGIDLSKFTNSKIGETNLNGEGARLTYRYENGVMTNVPLWPWPMEQRIRNEMGISVQDTIYTPYVAKYTNVTATPEPLPSFTPSPTATPTPTPAQTPTATPITSPVPTTSGLRINVPIYEVNGGDPQLDANNWSSIWAGKISQKNTSSSGDEYPGGYAQVRMVGAKDGVRVYIQVMALRPAGTVHFDLNGVISAVKYGDTTTGWEFGERCENGVCRGWTAYKHFDWSVFGGRPAFGTTWPLAFASLNGKWEGTLHWGLPNYSALVPSNAVLVEVALSADAVVGGGTVCGAPDFDSGFFPSWGNRNWQVPISPDPEGNWVGAQNYATAQNQWDVADYPCYARYYYSWAMSKVPANAQIVKATLTLKKFGNNGYGEGDAADGSGITVHEMYEITPTWTETGVTWDNAPLPLENISRRSVGSVPATCPNRFCSPGIPEEFDVTEIAKRAKARASSLASGLMYTSAGQYHSGKHFWSREAEEAPVVKMWYTTGTAATPNPTAVSTVSPTAGPTAAPTAAPTVAPTALPTTNPTAVPTIVPTSNPTLTPTVAPTATPKPTTTPEPIFICISLDLDGNGRINSNDLQMYLVRFLKRKQPDADANCSGKVNFADLRLFYRAWRAR